MLGEQPLCYNFGVKTVIDKRGVAYFLNRLEGIFDDGDIVFGNLEAPISNITNKAEPEASCFRANPIVVSGLKKLKFNILSVANNHSMDHGEKAFLTTIALLAKVNIIPIGVSNRFEFLNVKGLKIAINAYSFIEDFMPICLYNKVSSAGPIIDNIKNIRCKADLIIISLHWGFEYVPVPSPEQIEIGRILIDAGADLIIGHHAHIIQGYEIYKGKPIIYGIGNFIFDDSYIKDSTRSFIAKIELSSVGQLIDFSIIPIICDSKEYFPQIADGIAKDEIMNSISLIRTDIENKRIKNYSEEMDDYKQSYKGYKKIYKRSMRIHFIKNIYKYPLRLTFAIFKEAINNCKVT